MPTQPHPNDLRDLYINLNPNGWCDEDLEKDSIGFVDPHTSQDFNSFRAGHQVGQEDSERLTAERDALQQRLNAVEEENDRLLQEARGLVIQLHATYGNTENHEDCQRDLLALENRS